MNMRTITLYAVYNPKRRRIVLMRQFKKDISKLAEGFVVVKLTGHYFPPRRTS